MGRRLGVVVLLAVSGDFIALVAEVSGTDLTSFLDAWPYADEKPALPTGG